MKNPFPKFNFKLPTIPKHAKWALWIVSVLAGLAFMAFFGYTALLIGLVACGIVAVYWPAMLVYVVAGGVLGSLISHKRSGIVSSGLSAGIFYALLTLLVGLIAVGAHAVSKGLG
jgi:hypothetical protein